MERTVELAVALPGLAVVRATTAALHTGVKDFHGIGGIYDQAQLTRHFKRLVGTTPAQYGKSARGTGPSS